MSSVICCSCLSTGFEEDTPLSIADMDFCAVVNAINRHYA